MTSSNGGHAFQTNAYHSLLPTVIVVRTETTSSSSIQIDRSLLSSCIKIAETRGNLKPGAIVSHIVRCKLKCMGVGFDTDTMKTGRTAASSGGTNESWQCNTHKKANDRNAFVGAKECVCRRVVLGSARLTMAQRINAAMTGPTSSANI
jgi:hypothetical protein